MLARTAHCVRVASQYDQRCRLTDSAAPEMPARSSGYVCVLIWPVPLLTIALPVTPISLFRFRKTSSIVSPHAPLVLFRQAHVPTKKGGLPVSYFHCRDDEMQVNCREAAHLDIWTPHCLHIDIQGPCVFPVVTAPRLPAAAFSGTIAMQDSTRSGFWSVPHCGSPEVERAEVKN
jgi:hypothetical protein